MEDAQETKPLAGAPTADDDASGAGESDASASAPAPYPTWMRLFMFCVFWSCTAFSIVLPSLAPYLERMGADPLFLGWTVATFCFGEMIGALVFGKAYNVVSLTHPEMGPAHVLTTSILCGVAGSVLYVMADTLKSPWTCFWGRFLTGLWTGGKQAVEQAFMAERAPPEQLTEYTADLGTCAVVGFTCGPAIGAVFAAMPSYRSAWITIDQFTGPGLFLIFICTTSAIAVEYYLPKACRGESAAAGYTAPGTPPPARAGVRSSDSGTAAGVPDNMPPPSGPGLKVCLVLFFVHYYNFAVRKRHFLRRLYIKCIILPRQARDNHRENSKKVPFSQVQETITTPFVLAAYNWDQVTVNLLFVGVVRTTPLFERRRHFDTTNDHFTKTGSGQT